MNKIIRFGKWEFDTDSGELKSGTSLKRLEPTIGRLLNYLLQNQNRVIRRDELIEKVWNGRIVSDDPINRSISVLRQELTPHDKQAFIKTVPRKGYSAAFPAAEIITSIDDTIKTESPASNEQSGAVLSSTDPKNKRPFTHSRILIVTLIVCVISILLSYQWSEGDAKSIEVPKLAVLPFKDLSQNKQFEYISDGVSDNIIHLISQVNGLDVTARTTSFSYKSSNATIAQIASDLEVNYIVEGSVQIFENDIRVIARLIDVETQTELWSENFTREFNDIFLIQDNIASAVVISLKGTVLEGKNTYQPDFETYEKVLLGLDLVNDTTNESDIQAISLFRQAIAAEPRYALPHTLLARVLKRQFDTNSYTHIYPSEVQQTYLNEVENLLEAAIELDPFSSEAHNLRALMLLHNGQTQEAGIALNKAVELAPNNSQALIDLGNWLQKNGRPEEALTKARYAYSLDRKSNYVSQSLAQILWVVGRSEEAVRIVEKNIQDHPNSANNYSLLSRWTLQLGKPGKAMLYAMKEKGLDPDNPNKHWQVCLMHYQLWDKSSGNQCSRNLLGQFPDYYEAQKWLYFDDYEQATELIQAQINKFPNNQYYRLQLADLAAYQGQHEFILSLLQPIYPDLFTDKPNIHDWTLWAVRLIAGAKIGLGQTEKAENLLNLALSHVENNRKLQGGGFSSGIDDVFYLVMLGNQDKALIRLNDAIDNRWSFYSSSLPTEPVFRALHNNSEFQRLLERQRSFMVSQQQWYQARLRESQ